MAISRGLQQSKRLLTLSLAITAAIAAVEIVGGILSGSISLVSDAVHVFTHEAYRRG